MPDVRSFVVMPNGKIFNTSDLSDLVRGNGGDQNDAFKKAHHYAAQKAAAQKIPCYVIHRTPTGDTRSCFGPDAWRIPGTVLYCIACMGYASAWDYTSKTWVPIQEDEAYSEVEKSVCV